MEICSASKIRKQQSLRMYHLITFGKELFLILLISVFWKHLLLLLLFFNENINGTV